MNNNDDDFRPNIDRKVRRASSNSHISQNFFRPNIDRRVKQSSANSNIIQTTNASSYSTRKKLLVWSVLSAIILSLFIIGGITYHHSRVHNETCVMLDKKTIYIKKGSSDKEIFAVVNSNNSSACNIKWESSDTNIADYISHYGNCARIIGIEVGECYITANIPNQKSSSVRIIVYDDDKNKKDDVLAYNNEEYGEFIKDYVKEKYFFKISDESIQYVDVDNNDFNIKELNHSMITRSLIFDMSVPESISQETIFNAIISQFKKCNLINSYIWNGYVYSTIYYVPMDKNSSSTKIPILSRWTDEESYGYTIWRCEENGFIVAGDPLTG